MTTEQRHGTGTAEHGHLDPQQEAEHPTGNGASLLKPKSQLQ